MAKNGSAHPYIPSAGMIVQTFTQLRKMFPAKVEAETLKKLSIAPKNESMVINVLRFLGFIDEESNKTEKAGSVFLKHNDDAFAMALEKVVKESYKDLFESVGDNAWQADRGTLIGFFRVHDETSALTATRQQSRSRPFRHSVATERQCRSRPKSPRNQRPRARRKSRNLRLIVAPQKVECPAIKPCTNKWDQVHLG